MEMYLDFIAVHQITFLHNLFRNTCALFSLMFSKSCEPPHSSVAYAVALPVYGFVMFCYLVEYCGTYTKIRVSFT